MKAIAAPIVAVLALGVLADGLAQPPVKQALVSKGWFTDYETARAEAKRTGKPLMIVFRCEP
jgi:hypothetical protein